MLPNNYMESAPVQLSKLGTPVARVAIAATNTSPQSFLETRTSATKAASEVVKQLSLGAEEETKAEALNSRSIELRASASSIVRMASEQALQAGTQAAQKVAEQLLD